MLNAFTDPVHILRFLIRLRLNYFKQFHNVQSFLQMPLCHSEFLYLEALFKSLQVNKQTYWFAVIPNDANPSVDSDETSNGKKMCFLHNLEKLWNLYLVLWRKHGRLNYQTTSINFPINYPGEISLSILFLCCLHNFYSKRYILWRRYNILNGSRPGQSVIKAFIFNDSSMWVNIFCWIFPKISIRIPIVNYQFQFLTVNRELLIEMNLWDYNLFTRRRASKLSIELPIKRFWLAFMILLETISGLIIKIPLIKTQISLLLGSELNFQ